MPSVTVMLLDSRQMASLSAPLVQASRRARRRVQTEEERIAGGQHIGTVRVHDLAMEIDLLVDAGRGIRLLR